MKRLLFIGLLCLYSTIGMSHYYYYRGNQLPLKINTDSVVLYTINNSRALDNDSIQSIVIATHNLKQYSAKRDATISSIEYIIGDSITRKMSNYFYIKLHNSADTILLNDMVEETRTHLLGEVPYMENWYKIMVSQSTINNTLEMSNYFYETGLFSDVDPGFVFHFTPNCTSDSLYSLQWGLPIVNACSAWAHTTGERSIRVAILDDGIDVNHSEFSSLSFIHPYDCYRNKTQQSIYGSHGTFVTGVLAANHNSQKIAGIAPNITIIPISHIQDADSTSCMGEELASGIAYAVKQGADIINCSWGDKGGLYYNNLHSSLLESSLNQALTEGRNGKGCIVVFASGNYGESGFPVDYPGCFDSRILIVGSMHSSMRRSYFTSYRGGSLDVLAPGENIYSTTQNNGYDTYNGTSFAAPIVSGIAALILSVNPNLSREGVNNIIELTAIKVGNVEYKIEDGRPNGKWNEEMGYGLVDAYAAVVEAQNRIPKIQGSDYICINDTINFSLLDIPEDAVSYSWTTTAGLVFMGTLDIVQGQGSHSIRVVPKKREILPIYTKIDNNSSINSTIDNNMYVSVTITMSDSTTYTIRKKLHCARGATPLIEESSTEIPWSSGETRYFTITNNTYAPIDSLQWEIMDVICKPTGNDTIITKGIGKDIYYTPHLQPTYLGKVTITATNTFETCGEEQSTTLTIGTYHPSLSLVATTDGILLHVSITENKEQQLALVQLDERSNYTLEIWHSTEGCVHKQSMLSNHEQINITGFRQGTYILLLKENGNIISQTKIII